MSSLQDSPLSHQTVTTSFNCTDTTCVPFLLPVCLGEDTTSPLQLLIPGVAGPDAAVGQCAPSGSNEDFALSWVTPRGPNTGLLAQVTVQPGRLFSPKPADRQALRDSFRAFCEALDALEQQSSPNCLLPGATAILANRIASSIPLTLDELLYYYYGLDSALRCVDLHPGMRLAVEGASYQFVNAASKRESQANAFTPDGITYLTVDRNPDQTISFNPFLQALAPYQVSPRGPLAGLLDLYSTYTSAGSSTPQTYQRRYFRLIYPSQFPGPTEIGSQPQISQSVTLLGANTLAELNQATQAYVQTRSCAGSSANSIICAYFQGRVAVTPEIPVVVQGAVQYLPLGSTFQDILDTLLLAPPQTVADQINQGVTFWRYAFNALCPQTPPQTYGQNSLNFTQAQQVADEALELTVPLIKGDAIRLSLSPQSPTAYYKTQTTPLSGSGDGPVGPYLVPIGASAGQPLLIPNVAGSATSGCEISSESGFALSWNGQTAQVTVPAAAFSDDTTQRAALMTAFTTFRQALDDLERTTSCLVPGGARYIAGLVAGSIPLRFDEILFYRYNLDPVSRRYLDLQPGMCLVLEAGAYQFVAPSPQTGSTLNAYTARGQTTYQVVRNIDQQLSFSPFLREVASYQVNKGASLSGGLLDLNQADSGRRHYRLIYPASFLPTAPDWSSTATPLPSAATNVVLLGADSLGDLESATTAVLAGQTPTQTGLVLRYFAGRSSLIPQVRVSIQGQLQWVPVGTSLQQVIDRFAVLTGDEVYDFVSSGPGSVLARAAVPVIQNTVLQGLGTYPVQFDQTTVTVTGSNSQPLTQWSVPLVAGDLVLWPWST